MTSHQCLNPLAITSVSTAQQQPGHTSHKEPDQTEARNAATRRTLRVSEPSLPPVDEFNVRKKDATAGRKGASDNLGLGWQGT